MPRRPEILTALQDHGAVLGVNLLEYAGWRTRGSETFAPKGSVNHHTAGPVTGVFPSLPTLVNGRSDLPGPLCNAGLDRYNNRHSPRIHLIAAGRANHAGSGGWAGLSGNSSVWGLEVEHSGTSAEPVTDEQWEMMYLWHAAACDVSGVKADFTCQHFEWAPTRKIDFVKSITNPTAFRQNVGAHMAFTAEQEKKIYAAAVAILDGAPGFGILPINIGVTRANWHLDGVKVDGHVPAPIKTVLLEQMKKDQAATIAAINAIPQKVVAALPPASTGGLTEAQVEAACTRAIAASGLQGLLPGQ